MEPYAPAFRDLLPWALALGALAVLLWATAALWLHWPYRKHKPTHKVEDVMRPVGTKEGRFGDHT